MSQRETFDTTESTANIRDFEALADKMADKKISDEPDVGSQNSMTKQNKYFGLGSVTLLKASTSLCVYKKANRRGEIVATHRSVIQFRFASTYQLVGADENLNRGAYRINCDQIVFRELAIVC